VFFTTSQQLVDGDVDEFDDLYACDIPSGVPAPVGSANACSRLTEVSGSATDAQVQDVVAVSDDGSRVYFVAPGVLASNLGVGDVGPRAGVPNLYMWERDGAHPAGQTRFVARVADDGVGNDIGRAQMTPDGRYLLFITANQLVTKGLAADDDSASDVYQYDTGTHTIMRVSTSTAGGGGNGVGFNVLIPGASAMTADGSTVIFESAEALSSTDTNGVTDVYGWRDGQVSLISSGGGDAVGITPSGRDIFFATDAPVLVADGDVNRDIYDARVGGGLAAAETRPPCSGDPCQPVRSQRPSLTAPFTAGSGSGSLTAAAPVLSLRAVSAAQRKSLAATGKVTLTVTANVPGTVNATARATIGGRSVTVGSARGTLAVAGRVAVPLTLSKRARSQLASRGRLTISVAVSHSKVALDRVVTLRLTRARARSSANHAAARRSVPAEGVR
jgi:Tol biopolymer transport system component